MQEPLILDRYRQLEVRGKGGSGVVDICWDTRIQRRVAIKHLPLHEQGAGTGVPGLAEARTAALLSHPNIVSVLDFETSGEEALLIMEAIEGPSLSELIDEMPAGTLDLDMIASISSAVGDALDFAHENQVLHLDIKPDNILISPNGTTKVSDFGVSELADAQGFGEATGGTIGYMPIEQMTELDLDQRCDEFSLAVVVYEMLTGRNPFVAPSLEASEKLIKQFDFAAPSQLRDDIGPELDEVLLRAMAPNREERFETILDFMESLKPLLGSERAGKAKLKSLLTGEELENEERNLPTERGDLWERLSGRPAVIAGRLGSAAICWLVAQASLSAWPGLSTELAYLLALIPAGVALASPLLGALLALLACAFCVALGSTDAPLLGAIIALAALAWGIGGRKRGASDVNCTLVALPLAVCRFSPLAPYLMGFCLPVKRTAIAAGVSALLLLVLEPATGSSTLFTLSPALESNANVSAFLQSLTSVSTWIRVATWIVSAVLMSALCARSTRVSSILGASLCTAVLIGGTMLASWCATRMWTTPSSTWLLPVLLAFAVMIVIGVLGAPRRIKE